MSAFSSKRWAGDIMIKLIDLKTVRIMPNTKESLKVVSYNHKEYTKA